MATRGTGKTFEEFLEEAMESGKSKYNETEAKVRGDAEQNINNQNAVIDKAAQAKTSQYQKNIDEAPQRFAGAYDASYIDELVARKNLENTMADMGLTDSGLNRSQQTAISVMRGNADAKTRAQQNDYVTNLQDSIDQVLAQAETDKATYANQVNSNTDSYLSQLWTSMEQNANTTAASRYKAQEESLDAIYKAELEAEAEAEKQRQEALERQQDYAVKMLNAGYVQQEDGSWVKDYTAEQTTFATKLIAEGYSPEDAVLTAKLYYGTANEQDQITQAGKQLGYSGDQLTAYVNAGGGDAGVEAVNKMIFEGFDSQLLKSNIDTSKLTKFFAGDSATIDWLSSQTMDLEDAVSYKYGTDPWDQNEWNKSVKKSYDRAIENAKKEGLDGDVKDYAIAKAVGEIMFKAFETRNNSTLQNKHGVVKEDALATYIYNALGQCFSGTMLVVAAKAAGLSVG